MQEPTAGTQAPVSFTSASYRANTIQYLHHNSTPEQYPKSISGAYANTVRKSNLQSHAHDYFLRVMKALNSNIDYSITPEIVGHIKDSAYYLAIYCHQGKMQDLASCSSYFLTPLHMPQMSEVESKDLIANSFQKSCVEPEVIQKSLENTYKRYITDVYQPKLALVQQLIKEAFTSAIREKRISPNSLITCYADKLEKLSNDARSNASIASLRM